MTVNASAAPSVLHEWKEARLKTGQRYVGLAVSEKRIFSCTTNGALRLTELVHEGATPIAAEMAALPMRLCDWRLSISGETFAYGGDEVELSVWDTEEAFSHREGSDFSIDSKKRKRDQLLPGEVWRAKNVPNDGLSLRHPVNITALTYLQPSASASHHHLLTGTKQGNVRRYDTRAARRPVADWKGVVKIGGVSTVEKGLAEHEVFVADHGCNLLALDLRNGRVVYGYKGLSGAVSSLAPSPALLASVSQDRFLRLHSTFAPPVKAGSQQDRKGEVLDKTFTKTIPTVVVWDQEVETMSTVPRDSDDDEDNGDDDVWDVLEDVDDDRDEGESGSDRRGKKGRVRK